MPTKNQVLLKFQEDLRDLNASFEAELGKIEKARIRKFLSIASARALVDQAENSRADAGTELKADRSRATAGRETAIAEATQERRDAFKESERAWERAEEEAERARDDKRREENRKHEDKLEEISKILPMYEQTKPREAENARHEKGMNRIQEDFNIAWDRAREKYQSANQSALDDELRETESANDAERVGLDAAQAEYDVTLENAAAKLHDALLKSAETKEFEEAFQQQLRDTRQRWEIDKAALRAEFKKDYDNAG